jgi:hypothetical protein
VDVELAVVGGGTTEVTGLGEVRGTIAASTPLPDGFLLVMSPDSSEFNRWRPDPVTMEVSRIVDADTRWTQRLQTSAFLMVEGPALATDAENDEFALAYLVDEHDTFDNAFVVERRSLATGELIQRSTYSNATSYASLDLALTDRGFSFVWSPSSSLAQT